MDKLIRQPNTEYVLSISYGKDSLACLGAIEQLGWPLDRIIHAEVWATDDISADLPPMVEFKAKGDKIIKERYGITVEHYSAMMPAREGERRSTFERQFYKIRQNQQRGAVIYGWPCVRGTWCNSKLKQEALNRASKSNLRAVLLPYTPIAPQPELPICGSDFRLAEQNLHLVQRQPKEASAGFSKRAARGAGANTVSYIGIAADEPERIARHQSKKDVLLPLVEAGWTEADCRKWCEENDLLSPIYTTAMRGGCWFCHNQRVEQLRLLRKNYPEYWALMLKWDTDSPVTFKADGHTVHDFDRRFALEDEGLVPTDNKFKWRMLQEENQYRWF